MAKRKTNYGQRKRNVKFAVIKFDAVRTLLTLGDGSTTAIGVLSSVFGRDAYVISCDGYWTIKGLTDGDGPLEAGFVHSDLSAAELVEALSAEPTSPGEIIEREQANRPVRFAGMFSGIGTNEVLNNGKFLRTKINMTLDAGQNVNFYIANLAGKSLETGASVRLIGRLYVRWL